jgi:hypothetical protein
VVGGVWWWRRRRAAEHPRFDIDAETPPLSPTTEVLGYPLITPWEPAPTSSSQDTEKRRPGDTVDPDLPPLPVDAPMPATPAVAPSPPALTTTLPVASGSRPPPEPGPDPQKFGYHTLFSRRRSRALHALPTPPAQTHEVDAGLLPPMYDPAWRRGRPSVG